MEVSKGIVMVIMETDLEDKGVRVIGVATSREEALDMIKEYYGENKANMSNFRDIRDSGLEFTCNMSVSNPFGGEYEVTVMDFILNNI